MPAPRPAASALARDADEAVDHAALLARRSRQHGFGGRFLTAAEQRRSFTFDITETTLVQFDRLTAHTGNWLNLTLTGQYSDGNLITDIPAAAVCLANRQRGVRAALGYSLAAVSEAVNMIAANLLVIDPRSRSLHEMRRFTRELVRAGRPERSTVIGERLN